MKKLKIGIVCNEYFGAAKSSYGGFGFLARYIVAKLFPKYANVELEVLMGLNSKTHHPWFKKGFFAKEYVVDGVSCFWIPRIRWFAQRFLNSRKYDAYLTIETAGMRALYQESRKKIPIIFWIQDPRPWYEWREIMSFSKAGGMEEPCYFSLKEAEFVHKKAVDDEQVRFITQARTLNEKAFDLYRLKDDVPVDFIPNPLEIPADLYLPEKTNSVIFLGRLADVKRVWLFCEVAKMLPEYEFFIMGEIQDKDSATARILPKYQNGDIKNLHFCGHTEGEQKQKMLREAKILVNCSIHEALPVSFVEALMWGTLLVSCQNPDNLTERFGAFTGKVLGDGWESVPKFADGIKKIMSDEAARERLSREAQDYVRQTHAPEIVFPRLEKIIREEIAKRNQ